MNDQLKAYEDLIQELANAHLVENLELHIPALAAKARLLLERYGVEVPVFTEH